MGSFASPLSSRTVSYATLRARHLDGSPRVLQLFGEADIATLGMLRRELAHLAATHQADVVVDVTGLEFCDVASAHLILTARRRVPVTISGATGSVKRVFDLVSELQEQRLSSQSSADADVVATVEPESAVQRGWPRTSGVHQWIGAKAR